MSETPVTLILGGGKDARRVRSALVDLAALGMIDRFLWAETNTDMFDSDVQVDSISLDAAGQLQLTRTELSQALVNDGRREALIIVLDMAGDPDPDAGSLRDWRSTVDSVFNRGSTTLHLFVPAAETSEPAQFGMQTLVLSPEDAETPLVPVSPVAYPTAQHTATSLASLAGLWTTAESSPYVDAVADQQLSASHGYARLVRTYHHSLDASETEAYLHDRVFNLDHNLPHPRLANGSHVVDAGDDAGATRAMSRKLMKDHEEDFVSPRTPLKTRQNQQVRGWQMLKQFFSFFFRAVIGSPRIWLQEIQTGGQKVMAKSVQNLLYGKDSNVEVIIGGQSGRSFPSMEELGAASHSLSSEFGGTDRELELAADPALVRFWRSYADTSLTLVDGHERVPGAGPRHHNIPAIVSDSRWAVPSEADAFDGDNQVLRNQLGAKLGQTRVQGYDPYGAERYKHDIDYASQQTTDSGVRQLKTQFEAWRQQHSHSYAWQVGTAINGAMDKARDKVQQCRADAQSVREQLHNLPDSSELVRRLSRKLRWVSVIWFILLLLIVYLCLSHYNPEATWALVDWPVTWQRALFAGIALTVICLIIQMLIFARANRGISDRIENRRILQENEEIIADDLKRALGEVGRTSGAYSQFLAWSAILGRTLAHPFGEFDAYAKAGGKPESGLPRNTVISDAELASGAAEQAVAALRQEVFPAGWAKTAFDANLDRAMAAARSRVAGSEDRTELFGQPGTNSQLAAVAEVCRTGEGLRESEHATRVWSAGLEELRNNAEVLHSGITGKGPAFDIRSAMNTIQSGQAASSEFVHAAMNAQGINKGGTKVDESIRHISRSRAAESLSESFTVVEYGLHSDLRAFAKQPPAQGNTAQEVPAVPGLPSLGDTPETERATENHRATGSSPATPPAPGTDPIRGFDGLL